MGAIKTITISHPITMGREVEKVAKEEHRTVSELTEKIKSYRIQHT